jgi:Flp pilus assembly protein TadG
MARISACRRPRHFLRRFGAGESGSVTVEFVLWLPLLFVLLTGAFVFFDLFRASSKAVKATYALGDIVSRQTSVDDAFLDDLLPVLAASMVAGEPGQWLRITSIRWDEDDGAWSVVWSHNVGGGVALDDAAIPTGIMPELADQDTVILTETFVPYAPLGGAVIGLASVTWDNVTTHRPRFVQAIPKT